MYIPTPTNCRQSWGEGEGGEREARIRFSDQYICLMSGVHKGGFSKGGFSN